MLTRKTIVGTLASMLILTMAGAAFAGYVTTGTFTTPKRTGGFSFTPLRAFRGGVEGKFVIAGKSYPGSMYYPATGKVGYVWYYGTSGVMAGTGVVSPAATTGQYSGTIQFTDKAGNVTEEGTLKVTIK